MPTKIVSTAERLANAVDLVGAQVIHEDDIAFAQRRREDPLNISDERWSIHRAINDIGRRQAIDAQRCNQRQRLPVAVRNTRNETLATR